MPQPNKIRTRRPSPLARVEVSSTQPKLDPMNARAPKVVVGGGIATTPLADSKAAPQAGLINSEQL